MALSSAAIHLNLTRERRTFLCRFVNASAGYKIFMLHIAKRMTCPRSLWDIETVPDLAGLLRQMVLVATMPYSNSNAVCRGASSPLIASSLKRSLR